ncbi:transposase [Clostridium botulinum]|uniref:transposase n=1 Tax=Clostridium botulinum TaxID=1491 RepID=UPI00035BB094|nr:transposase [Clostridium botulinum]EPS46829.1 transposase [Clostridium botulinum CFSAN002367]MCR1178010.1 transposase [Clostridium botulinum]
MSIDIGLDNLATITFKNGINQYVYCGKKLKSVNSYANKRIAYLQAIEMKKYGSDKFKNTKEINRLRKYRNNFFL